MTIESTSIESPVGPLVLSAVGEELCGLSFGHGWSRGKSHLENASRMAVVEKKRLSPFLRDIRDRLRDYFRGELEACDQLPLRMFGTDFQKEVWSLLREIPVGETRSYGDLAYAIGRPGASRAVGAANGRNPVAIIVPCHRVIGQNGSLTGFGGGLPRKRWLLEHEGVPLQGELFIV